MRIHFPALAIVLLVGGHQASAQQARHVIPLPGAGSRIEHETAVAVKQPGPHGGGGTTTAFPFFADIEDLPLVFRKRALHPGSAIGPHMQDDDEIYYVISGTGEYTLDGRTTVVSAGSALLTRRGSTHSLRQTGSDDLVILITYLKRS